MSTQNRKLSYSLAINEALHQMMSDGDGVFLIGQGVESPWYVGNTAQGLLERFGPERVIDTPISENAITGSAVGAALAGMRPVVVHPRMDFMLYAFDPIINEAAKAYEGVIPADRYHQPYMPIDELGQEMKEMTFFGWEEDGELVGVMGFQPVKDVTLIRHAYVLPQWQRKGIGSKLLNHLKGLVTMTHLLVGTWADARWAIVFYQRHGFSLMPNKDDLLQTYWNISQRQIETSVVLGSKWDRKN